MVAILVSTPVVLQLGSYQKFRPQTKIRKILSIDEQLICEWEDPDLMNRKNLFKSMFQFPYNCRV